MRSGFFVLFVLALVAGTALGAKGGGGKGDQTDDNDNAPSSTIVKDPLRPAVGINGSADDRCTLQVHGPTCWGTDLSCVPLTPTVFTNVACQHTYIDELTVGTLNGGGASALCLEGYYRVTANSACTLCPISRYCPIGGLAYPCTHPCTNDPSNSCSCARCHPAEDKCLQCARGAAPNSDGQCGLCEPGYVSADGIVCVPCTPGTYTGTQGGHECLPCDADTFSAAAATVCVPCPEGTTSNPGSSQCVSDASCSGSCASVCPRGTYTVDPNAETPECVACPPRTWSDGTTTTSCTPCATDCVECYATTGACVRCTPGMEPADSGSGCTDCSAGEYSADGAACIPCIPGTTSSSPKSAGCTPCGVGTYSTGFGQTACTTCSLGTFNPSTGAASADACQQCPPGTHAGGGVPCTPCTHGLYAPDPGLSGGCASCRPGTYADYNGAAHCHTCDPLCTDTCTPAAGSCTCPDGHFLEGVACIACPHGSWNIQGATTCTPCEIGDRCPSCGQGYYFQQSSDTCKPCPFGEWSDGTAIDVCTACLPNCDVCDPGTGICLHCADTYAHVGGNSRACEQCPEDTYYDGVSQTCNQCPPGTYYGGAPDNLCIACPAGSWNGPAGISTTCQDCAPGTADCATNSGTCVPTTGGCTGCSAGYGGSDCTPCEDDYWSDGTTRAPCQLCPYGCRSNDGTTAGRCATETGDCTICNAGFGGTECLECTDNTFTVRPTGGTDDCQPCSTTQNCVECYSHTGDCTLCDPDYGIIDGVCSPPPGTCLAGTYYDATNDLCIACPSGSWNGAGTSTTCQDCFSQTTNCATGLGTCDAQTGDCLTCSASHGGSTCTRCADEFWSAGGNLDPCQPCSTMPNCIECASSMEFCLLCDLDYVATNGVCSPPPGSCLAGTYYDATGDLCIACPAGSWNGGGTSTTCQDCFSETTNCATGVGTCDAQTGDCLTCSASHGGSTCTRCADEFWSAGGNLDPCQPCPAGCTYNGGFTLCAKSSGTCVICKSGYGGARCDGCVAGTYSVEPGDTRECRDCSSETPNCADCVADTGVCTECDTGYVLNGGACVCPAGTYYDATGDSCIACSAGSWNGAGASTTCQDCFSETTNCATGVGTCDAQTGDCLTCSASHGGSTCTRCADEFWSAGGNLDPCQPCPAGCTYNGGFTLCAKSSGTCVICKSGYGGARCDGCVAGTYSVEPGDTRECRDCSSETPNCADCVADTGVCTACDTDYVLAEGACITGLECQAGSYYDLNLGSCTACPLGTWSNLPQSTSCLQCSDTPNCIACVAETGLCTACDTGYVLNGAVCDLVQECLAGTYYDAATDSCIPCDPGFWSAGGNSDPCLACPSGCSGVDGFCSDTTGECLICNTGYGEDEYGGGACVECPAGTFGQFLVPPESCVACSFNTPNCIDCAVDTGICYECEEGYEIAGDVCDPVQ